MTSREITFDIHRLRRDYPHEEWDEEKLQALINTALTLEIGQSLYFERTYEGFSITWSDESALDRIRA